MKEYDYEALNRDGFPYWRKARVVGELPHGKRADALKSLVEGLGVGRIYFGVPLFATLGLTKNEAKKDSRGYLLFSGDDMPLSLLKTETE